MTLIFAMAIAAMAVAEIIIKVSKFTAKF